ncbi:carbonic anhydrase 6-like [Acomys russatus]|uniref:carbonic anhydrase 6-like n=1 Tax=Acomys russatus TaxID=60746 RepID=UPI0021E2F3FB|nr:carbonic anhydrase 6-like [Acomys russatus]
MAANLRHGGGSGLEVTDPVTAAMYNMQGDSRPEKHRAVCHDLQNANLRVAERHGTCGWELLAMGDWPAEDEWAEKYPTCQGKRQSPIALQFSKMHANQYLMPLNLSNYEKGSQLSMTNNGHTGETTALKKVNIRNMLPQDIQHYYTYLGSLTTPPCTENVKWFVFLDTTKLSLSQVTKIENSVKDPNNETLQNNYRETQPLNGRVRLVSSSNRGKGCHFNAGMLTRAMWTGSWNVNLLAARSKSLTSPERVATHAKK